MANWHPMYSAIEVQPGVWVLEAQYTGEYGRVELRRVSPDVVRYKATHRGELLGWATTLRLACERVHQAYLATLGRSGAPKADWGGTPWHERNPEEPRNAPRPAGGEARTRGVRC